MSAAMLVMVGASEARAGSWSPQPYVKPNLGVAIYGGSGVAATGVGLGAQGGVRYANADGPVPLGGTTRVSGTYTLVAGGWGHDVRVGSFFGPQMKLASASAGVDVFHNGLTVGSYTLPGAVGVDLPLDVTVGPSAVYLLGGITPALVFDSGRHVDWKATDAFGFGHEFEWRVGAAVNAKVFAIGVTYSRRTVAPAVTSQGISIGVGIGG
jgi:hypothetical protein